MQIENYNCKKCGLTISSTCSKCDKIVDVEVLDDGCIVQKCERDWCKIKTGKYRGWIKIDNVWGSIIQN